MPLHFFYRHNFSLKQLNLDEILYLEAKDNYTRFVTAKNSFTVRVTLNSALMLLPENHFVRIHRSFAVAVQHIDVVGKGFVKFKSHKEPLPVSKKYQAEFAQRVIILEDATVKWILNSANLSEES